MTIVTTPVTTPVHERLVQASEWLLRLQGHDVPQEDVSAWLEWCYADPENLDAFDRAQQLFDQLREVDGETRKQFMRLARRPANSSVRPANNSPSVAGAVRAAVAAPPVRRRRVYSIAAAAGIALILIGALVWNFVREAAPGMEQREYRAGQGEHRQLTLADASTVTLGGASALQSSYTRDMRRLELKNGEAFFAVSRDRTRPFVVRAGAVTVTAVGTAFNVRRAAGRTEISVTEGAVDVSTNDGGVSQHLDAARRSGVVPLRIRAGQRAICAPNQSGVMVSSVAPAAAIAWTGGRFEYTAEPLASVIEDVNRYAESPVVIADARLNNLVFTGTVFRNRAVEWVRALDTIFPVRVIERADGVLELQALN